MMRRRVLIFLVALALSMPAPASANWLTKALDHAGDAGKGATRGLHGLDPDLGHALSQIKALPDRPGIHALAAEAGHEGHWRFVNAKGESFTAATPDEFARMRDSLLPGTSGKLALYLTPDSIFKGSSTLKDLPLDAGLFLAIRRGAYRLTREPGSGIDTYFAEIKTNLRARLDSEDLLDETLFQLAQPLKPASLRILALETGSADALAAIPRFDPQTRMALVDKIDPARLATSFARVRGQTVILTGRIEDGALKFIDAGRGSGTLPLDQVRSAARTADVNLVIVKADTPRQPGGKNWLWQTSTIPGLDTAVKQQTVGDFLSSIAPQSGSLTVITRRDGYGRAILDATPPDGAAAPISDTVTGWLDSLAGEALGRIAIAGIEADMRDESRQRELDARLIPGIPAALQWSYLIALGLSLFGLGTANAWWNRIWPPEDRAEYGSFAGYALARAVRMILFVLIFLPVAGLPLFIRYLALQAWAILTAPLRALRWLRNRLVPRTT
ncbi:MAG: hypothetical protein C0519_02770 [Hyphomicrobium sp.]|nr:hypothetical protein [Hyphomicrobium sp.]PPD08933.1 MAG: hypothetical protein CTY28_02395 [Hyphomicrobium sp.]